MKMVGVILAGGMSTRMKQDKALLKLDGISLLQKQFEMLERLLGKGNVIVSGNRSEYPHVTDIDSRLGPLEGLRSVGNYLVSKGQKNPLLVIPVDMPFMTDSGLNRLINFASGKPIVKFTGRQLPVVVNNVVVVLEAIEQLRSSTDKDNKNSFQNLFKKVQVQEIESEQESFFVNINTPEEWHASLS